MLGNGVKSMKSPAIAFTILIAILGMLPLSTLSPWARQDQDPSPGSLRAVLPTLPTAEQPTPLPRDVLPPTAVVEKLTSREALVERARHVAWLMGETDPELLDVQQTTIGQALILIGESPEDMNLESLLPPEHHTQPLAAYPVYLVRMGGKFQPTSAPGGKLPPRIRGIMYVIVDVNTGQSMGYGFTGLEPYPTPTPYRTPYGFLRSQLIYYRVHAEVLKWEERQSTG